MTALKTVMDKLEVKESDSLKTAFLKGCTEGAIQSCAILGAMVIVQNLTGIKLLELRKG